MSVVKLPVKNRLKPMREAFHDGLIEAWNTIVNIGTIDKASAMTMVGYLAAGTTAFRVIGDEPAARLLEQAARDLQDDWTVFSDTMDVMIDRFAELGN